jgi:hypothetical protein
MARTLTLFLIALTLVGCTRHGTRAAGPFAKKAPPDMARPVPPGPAANNSPLAIADDKVVPARATAPAEPDKAAKNLADLKAQLKVSADRWATVADYESVVTRRELNPKGETTNEVVVYQFRKEPMGLYTKTTSDAGKGREVLYSPAKHGDVIHAIVGQGDHKLFKAGSKAPAFTPDAPMVKEKARYSVREAGFGFHIARVTDWVAKAEAGKIPADALTFLGPVERTEVKRELVGVRLALRAGDDPMMPTGGVREWWFDPKPESPGYGLPVLITAADPKGKEVEFYLFEQLRTGVGFTDADFHPDRLDKKKK